MEEKIRHVAIIMDGNGRWAKKQGKVRTAGHYQGVENVRNIAIAANDLGVEVLTVFAFSTENWKRPEEEVSYLMKLPSVFFKRFLKELMEKNIRITMIGEMDQIPKDTAKVLQAAIDDTRENTGMILNFAMNYGGRREIVLAAQAYAKDVRDGKVFDGRAVSAAGSFDPYQRGVSDFQLYALGNCVCGNDLCEGSLAGFHAGAFKAVSGSV